MSGKNDGQRQQVSFGGSEGAPNTTPQQSVTETASPWAEEILKDLRTFLPKFWVVKPKAASIDSLIDSLRRAA